MYCSYKPPMIAVAVHDRSSTYELIDDSSEFVLSVVGESLADAAVFCGTHSLREIDKVEALNLDLVKSEKVSVCGLARAIANVECRKSETIQTGDHKIIVG